MTTRLNAVRAYAIKLAGRQREERVDRLLLGRGTSFRYATAQPALDAAVVYYGTAPDADGARQDQARPSSASTAETTPA